MASRPQMRCPAFRNRNCSSVASRVALEHAVHTAIPLVVAALRPPLVGGPLGASAGQSGASREESVNGFSTDIVLYGVPIRATRFEINAALVALKLDRLTLGRISRQGADLHVCIKLFTGLPIAGSINAARLTLAKSLLRTSMNWRLVVHQRPRRLTDIGSPLPLGGAPAWSAPIARNWSFPPHSSGQELRIASWNACGLTAFKQVELEVSLLELGVGICAVQESHERASLSLHLTHYQWLSRPRDLATHSKKSGGGVGFMVHKSLLPHVSVAVTTGPQEVMWLVVDGSNREAPPLILASVYLPCNSTSRAGNASNDRAFELLEADIVRFQQQGQVTLLGDFNSRVGQAPTEDSHIGMFGEDNSTINKNGSRLLEMLSRTDMFAVNSRVRGYLGLPQYTRTGHRGELDSILDYIIVNRDTFDLLSNKQIQTVDLHKSDHALLALPIPFLARPSRRHRAPRRFGWKLNRLRGDLKIQEAYANALQDTVEQFLTDLEEINSRASMSNKDKMEAGQKLLAGFITPAAKTTIGRTVVGSDPQARWWDRSIQLAVHKCRNLRAQLRSMGTDSARLAWRGASNALAKLKRNKLKAIKKTEMRRINRLAKDPNQSKAFWQALDWKRPHMLQGCRKAVPSVRSPAGGLVCDAPRVSEAFRQAFEKVGDNQQSDQRHYDEAHRLMIDAAVATYTTAAEAAADNSADNNPLGQDITELEIEVALKATKSYKASIRADPIVNELLRFGGAAIHQALAPLFNMALRSATVPAIWRAGEIICLHKKGDKSDVSNYRGITLMCALGKLYARVLNSRLMAHLDPLLNEAQCGFRQDRSCTDLVFSASQLIQGRIKAGKPTYAAFLDGEKAFDTVDRPSLFYKLWAKGVQGRLWLAIRGLMAQTSCRIRVGDCLSRPFTRNQGIDQGCLLSPGLYATFIDDLASDVSAALLSHFPSRPVLFQGLYADDHASLTGTPEECQVAVAACYAHSLKWRWNANLGRNKTAIVVFADPARPTPLAGLPITWGGAPIPQQSSYRYLGILLTEAGTWGPHLLDLTNRTSLRVNQLAKFLRAKDLSVPCKLLLVKACLLPILDYGSAVWHASQAQAGLLQTQYLKALKMILQCPVSSPTVAVLGDLGMPTLRHRWDLNKLKLEFRLQHMAASRDSRAVYLLDWSAGVGKKHMWCNKVKAIWSQLFPTRADRRTFQASLLLLSPGQFDKTIRPLIADRESTTLLRDMRQKTKLTTYSDIFDLESTLFPPAGGRHALQELCPFLQGTLSQAKRFKFLLRAGMAELRSELGRRSQGTSSSSGSQAPTDCPFCPGVEETCTHFVASCPHYAAPRAAFWVALAAVLPSTASELQQLPHPALVSHLLADTVGRLESGAIPGHDSRWASNLIEGHLWALWTSRQAHLPSDM